MAFKIRSVNENKELWTNLADEVEELENRDEMSCLQITCCFNICCFQINNA
ncbi:hypothetical protein [Paenibacillus sp. YYML68]|uniref:hypothetical protein n=1 Tax=Paenibacillus sp. YYML68 TaxID=2909250 RepID=UPI002491A563|nr:hypothetical protein [Paenibacillus sp. YYML68]